MALCGPLDHDPKEPGGTEKPDAQPRGADRAAPPGLRRAKGRPSSCRCLSQVEVSGAGLSREANQKQPRALRAMPKRSAGLILFRRRMGQLEVLLVHPGGPYFVKKDAGAWSMPKGEYTAGEDPQAVALREFEEETGVRPSGPFLNLLEFLVLVGVGAV